MVAPYLIIEPNGVYDDALLCSALDISSAALAKARRGGELHFARKGQRILYLGKWVIEWLGKSPRPKEVAHAS